MEIDSSSSDESVADIQSLTTKYSIDKRPMIMEVSSTSNDEETKDGNCGGGPSSEEVRMKLKEANLKRR